MKVKKEHYLKVCELLDAFDEGCKYVEEYNSMLHDYNGIILYQAESQFIKKVGETPGITITELSEFFNKTTSACSQLMYRMKQKGFIYQSRNEKNNREYNLFLTEAGEAFYHIHKAFEERCYQRTAKMLSAFSSEELDVYLRVQQKMNESFLLDVTESQGLSEKMVQEQSTTKKRTKSN